MECKQVLFINAQKHGIIRTLKLLFHSVKRFDTGARVGVSQALNNQLEDEIGDSKR